MHINFTDPGVQAAIIEALGGILAAAIAAIAATVIGKRFLDQQRLENTIHVLQQDVFFLLAVEAEHCQRHGQKLRVRDEVRKKGFAWSGKFTPGRVQSRYSSIPVGATPTVELASRNS